MASFTDWDDSEDVSSEVKSIWNRKILNVKVEYEQPMYMVRLLLRYSTFILLFQQLRFSQW